MKRRVIDWPERARQLAALVPVARLHAVPLAWAEKAASSVADAKGKARRSRRADTLAPASALPLAERWGVAFSGGADSLVLLLLLWAHWPEPERRARLVALHFNHKLRGRAANADEHFCRGVCAALGVKFLSGVWTHRPRVASEAQARAARHAFFEQHTRVLWLGHQQDDIAESMLMRLARGSGSGGLAAPRPIQTMPGGRVHLRPLLTLKKSELVAALRQAGIPWREDATNAGEDFFRNRIRHKVLRPWIAASQRDALAGAALARELLDEDDAALDEWVESLRPLTPAGALSLTALAGKPRAVWRRALRRWLALQADAGDLSRQGFEALMEALIAGRTTRQSLGREGFAVTRRGFLRYERKKKQGG